MNERRRAQQPGPHDFDPRRARILLGGILVLAFVLRVVYVLQSRANPFFDEPAMDAQYHAEWARAFSAGRTFLPGPFFRAPLYPWFLGVCFRVFGEDYLWPRIVQALLGTLSCGLVYAIGAHVFDRRTGLIAALTAATYWILVYFEGELLSPVLEVFLDLSAILLSLRIAAVLTPARFALAGLAGATWGLAAIVRPNVLLFVPLVALWIFVGRHVGPGVGFGRARTSLRTRGPAAALFALGVMLPILPITAYNRIAGGDTALIATNGGVNLWIGNNPLSDGSTAIVPGTRPDWWGGYRDSIRMAETEAGRALKPSEVSDHYKKKALAWMRAEPARALRHLAWKLELFWKAWELGNNQDERFFALRFGPILRFLPIGFGVLAPLGVVGFFLAARRWREILPLWGFLPVYTASVVMFFVNSRYRVPVLPVLAIFGAHALVYALDAWRARRFRAVTAVAIAVLALGAWVSAIPRTIHKTEAYGLWQLAVFDAQHGDPAAAVEGFEAAIRLRPALAVFHKDLAVALKALGRRREAEASLARALELEPAHAVALQQLFEIQLEDGRIAEARATAERIRKHAPHFATGLYDLGRVSLAEAAHAQSLGDAGSARAKQAEALRSFDECWNANRSGEDAFACAFGAGNVLAELGRTAEAIERFERAVAARPEPDAEGWYWQAQERRLQLQKGPGALALAEELARRFPSDPRAIALLARMRAR